MLIKADASLLSYRWQSRVNGPLCANAGARADGRRRDPQEPHWRHSVEPQEMASQRDVCEEQRRLTLPPAPNPVDSGPTERNRHEVARSVMTGL